MIIIPKQHHQPVSGDSSSNNNDKLSDGQPTLKQFVKANQNLDKNFDQHSKINQSIAKKIFSDLQPFIQCC